MVVFSLFCGLTSHFLWLKSHVWCQHNLCDAAAPLSWPLLETSLPIAEFSDVGNATRATWWRAGRSTWYIYICGYKYWIVDMSSEYIWIDVFIIQMSSHVHKCWFVTQKFSIIPIAKPVKCQTKGVKDLENSDHMFTYVCRAFRPLNTVVCV